MMSFKKIVIGIVVAVAAVTMTGCSQGGMNQAAVVEGQVITEAWLAQTAQAAQEVFLKDPQAATTGGLSDPVGYTLQNKVIGLVLGKALADQGVSIDDDVRLDFMKSANASQALYDLLADERTHDVCAGYVDLYLVNQMIEDREVDAELVLADLAELDVVINPRYGEWDFVERNVSVRVYGQTTTPLSTPTTFTQLTNA